jgi:hypothetical protein
MRCNIHNRFIPKTGCPICQDEIKLIDSDNLIIGNMKVSRQDTWIVMLYTIESILHSTINSLYEPEKRGLMQLKKHLEILKDRVEILNGVGLSVLKRFWGLNVVCEVSDRVDKIINGISDKSVLVADNETLRNELLEILLTYLDENQAEHCCENLIKSFKKNS